MTMSEKKALEIVGNRADWELRMMKKALSKFPFMNTEEKKERMEPVNVLLMARLRKKRGKK